MADQFSRDRLLPALLDRLIDERPHDATEAMESRVLSKAGLRQSVLRDLAWLFNAQAAASGEIDGEVFPHARRSTINFGIALSQKASMANAVRTAARYGSVNLYNTTSDPHTCTKAIDRAKEGTPTLGMSAADVTFEVRRGATETAARSGAALCTSSSASTTPPCQGSAQGDNLYVFAKYSTRLGIPMTPINTALDLVSVGVYRCEYS